MSFYLFPLLVIIVLFDMLGVQGDLGLGILVYPFVVLAAPSVFCCLFLIYLYAYSAIFYCIDWMWKELFQKEVNTIVVSVILTTLSVILFQWLWWTYFYTEISLPRRVIGWNIITIVFPIISLIGAILMDIEVVDEKA